MGRLDNRIAVITGIGGGMGREAAKRFAAEGAKVIGCDSNEEGLDESSVENWDFTIDSEFNLVVDGGSSTLV